MGLLALARELRDILYRQPNAKNFPPDASATLNRAQQLSICHRKVKSSKSGTIIPKTIYICGTIGPIKKIANNKSIEK
jgi:hypothetical protein